MRSSSFLPTILAGVVFAFAAAAAPAPKPVTIPQAVAKIVTAARTSSGAYDKLRRLCDDVGHRLSGSAQLESAVDWAVATMKADGHENVRTEPAMVRKWVRGRESATLLTPREQDLHMLGLGNSVGTPPEGISAEVVVIKDEADLNAKAASVKGKIVLFTYPMKDWDAKGGTGYGDAVKYRVAGPRLAGELGAVAVLIRSVTARSLRSPHTGVTLYKDSKIKIPGAALSVEDALLLTRLVESGKKVVVRLRMEARDQGEVPSSNVIAELRGREWPEEYVVIGGHLDSWDVGQGAHDDGAGVVHAMEALTLLRRLDLRPRRTVRVVLWTNEENGGGGAAAYAQAHAADLPRHVAAIESDTGGFLPLGFGVELKDPIAQAKASKALRALLGSMRPLKLGKVIDGASGADVGPLVEAGVPGMMLLVDDSKYFDYHHSEADTFDKVDPGALAEGTAAMAAMAYILAERPERLDRPVNHRR